jgi:hypothetical protein
MIVAFGLHLMDENMCSTTTVWIFGRLPYLYFIHMFDDFTVDFLSLYFHIYLCMYVMYCSLFIV